MDAGLMSGFRTAIGENGGLNGCHSGVVEFEQLSVARALLPAKSIHEDDVMLAPKRARVGTGAARRFLLDSRSVCPCPNTLSLLLPCVTPLEPGCGSNPAWAAGIAPAPSAAEFQCSRGRPRRSLRP